ncbi:DUF5977 domain-containing protein [Dyadobacter diqingensis]|uniref:DUF5977 domain-containing protein n=1 Tax=Dyadobacter diqingensis TaxID=2938121 RepID=UPI0020C52A26|nr:DUF5977 domain-containing protein [Dyadobacter diqingensis]
MIDFEKTGLSWLDVDMVRNEVQHIVQAADPATYPERAGLRYYLDVEVPEYPQASEFIKLIRLEGREKPAKVSDGAQIFEGCTFRIESMLSGKMNLVKPEKSQAYMSVIASLTTPYQLREIIEPAIKNQLLNSRVAMRAGLALRNFVSYEHRFFSRFQPSAMQFLTWQPKEKLISPIQEEYLYFLMNMSPLPAQINLRVRVTYSNGVRSVFTKKSIQGVLSFQVVCSPVGPIALGLTAADIVKYEVWLSDENLLRFTQVRTFNIDRKKYPYQRFVLFSNSFGGFDTLRLLGKSTEESDVTKNTAVKERETGKGLDYSELAVISVQENSGVEVSTGFFDRNQEVYLNYMRELMLSECVLEDTPWGYEALNLINDNIKYRDDDPGLIERSFQFRRTYSDINFSTLAPVAALPSRPTAWRGVGNVYLLDAYGKRTGLVKPAGLRKYFTDNGFDVVPLTQKPNVEGDKDYIAPSPDPGVIKGSTPFPNAAITRKGTFVKSNCAVGEDGMEAVITVPAGTFGGEKLGLSDALAEAEWKRLNTQDYANTYGSCAVAQNYAWNVPAGKFHYRSNMPAKIGVYHLTESGADKGNIQALQGQTAPYIFPTGSNDLDFPVESNWYYYIYGNAGQTIKVEIYKNGVLHKSETIVFANTEAANAFMFDGSLGIYTPVSTDRFLIKLTIL